jgi:predicted DNA-binding transcriptional regulator YafY
MKRLIKKIKNNKRLQYNKKKIFKQSSLTKTADWKDVDVRTNDITIILTDAMIQNSVVKINYENSGWRNILPYGWYVSKEDNILVYCYKENSAIRSYRLDRIIDLYIDDALDTAINEKVEETNPMDFEIMELPENNEEILELSESEEGDETPFESPVDESLQMLSDAMNDEQTIDNQEDLQNNDLADNSEEIDNNDLQQSIEELENNQEEQQEINEDIAEEISNM